MTKAEIVAQICSETGIEKDKALKVVEAFMVVVKDNIVNGEDIFLRGFGTFTTKTRKQKIGRLIKENKSVVVPEHKIPYFKPCEEFKSQLAK
ncbi:MAG: integration host factor subunit beta [Bacteroidaceae bacterium]|jgi:DNA-binding protein HU-beta|nr:integration host factor subunit beta [Bacteroidaceae bacterium]MBR6197132.1 integration host factor subunit beta [Bacteroidaceae bacterium]